MADHALCVVGPLLTLLLRYLKARYMRKIRYIFSWIPKKCAPTLSHCNLGLEMLTFSLVYFVPPKASM